MNSDKIKKRLEIYFSDGKVEVFDTRGTGDHFSIIVISNKFDEVNIVKRLKSRIFNTQKMTIKDVENFNSWIRKTVILLVLLKLVNSSRYI